MKLSYTWRLTLSEGTLSVFSTTAQHPAPTDEEKRSLIGLTVPEDSFRGPMAPSQKEHGGEVRWSKSLGGQEAEQGNSTREQGTRQYHGHASMAHPEVCSANLPDGSQSQSDRQPSQVPLRAS